LRRQAKRKGETEEEEKKRSLIPMISIES